MVVCDEKVFTSMPASFKVLHTHVDTVDVVTLACGGTMLISNFVVLPFKFFVVSMYASKCLNIHKETSGKRNKMRGCGWNLGGSIFKHSWYIKNHLMIVLMHVCNINFIK